MSDSGIRGFIESLLADKGKAKDFAASDPLFTSGLLDSMAATEVLLYLEADHGVDLADADFDISVLDTLEDLEGFLARQAA